MLSFIYQITQEFERQHGYRPNMLYLNRGHLAALRNQLPIAEDLDALVKCLGMDIVLSEDAVHPHVAWTRLPWRRAG